MQCTRPSTSTSSCSRPRAGGGYVAGDLGRVHTQLVGQQSQGLYLFVRNLCESLLYQVLTGLLHVLAQPLAKVVHCADGEVAVPHILISQRITHLEIKDICLVHLLIRPAKARFQHFQTEQHVHRHIGPGIRFPIEHGKRLLIQPLKHLAPKSARPRLLQHLSHPRR